MESYTGSTTPRPLAPRPPVAAPQGLVKLGKVQKVKRPRNNKAKQGRPSNLSISQKRKLVRLYIYTNLPLEAIRKLVEHFGTTQIQTRALQYILKSFLLDRYNMLRPGSADASHERILQIRLCQNTKKRRHQDIKEMFELDPPSSFSDMSVIDDIPHRSITDMDGMPAQEPIEILTSENSSDSRISVDQVESNVGTNYSSPGWGLGNASSTLTVEFGYVLTSHNVQELPLRSDQVQNALLTSDDPFMGAIGNESLDHLLLRPKEIETGAIVQTATELYLANDDNAATKLSHDRGIGYHSETINADESVLVPLAPQSLELPSTNVASRRSSKWSQSDKRNNDTNLYEDNHITIYDSGLRQSDLKALIDRTTKSSGRERDIIEELMTTFSISTRSPSTHSTLTIISTSGLPTGNLSNQRLRWDFPFHRYAHVQPPASALSQLTRSYMLNHDVHPQSSFVLPGSRDHVEGYLVSPGFGPTQWTFQTPHCIGCRLFFTTLFRNVSYFLCNQDVGWSDKYGNTSLHVAATLGACFNTLLDIIRSGVDVKRTNAAGQTFLHVLRRQDPYEWDNLVRVDPHALRRHDLKEWSKLVTKLKERGYDFNHRDAIGRTVWNIVPQSYRDELSAILQNFGIAPDFEQRVETPVISHIRSASTKNTINELLRGGANINERDSLGQTPLHVSVTHGKTDITGALLSHKPNLHARDVWGKGMLAAAMDVLRQVKSDASMYAKITACMTLAIDAGAIAEPTSHHEWRLPNYQHWPGDPTQLDDYLHGS